MTFGKVVSDPILYALCAAPFLAWLGVAWYHWRKKSKVVVEQIAEIVGKDSAILQLNGRIFRLENDLALARDEAAQAWRRWENAVSMVNGYGEGRVKIISNLERFGMTLDGNNEIVVHGPKMLPPVFKGGVMVKPAQMVPILAKGLEHDAPPPFDGDVVPIICWYRLVPDDKIKGQINEEFSHYEDAAMVLQDPKNRKNKTMVLKLPATNIPDPRGGTKFSGKWVWHQKVRTTEVSPRVLPANYEELKAKAVANLKRLRKEYEGFPDVGAIAGKV